MHSGKFADCVVLNVLTPDNHSRSIFKLNLTITGKLSLSVMKIVIPKLQEIFCTRFNAELHCSGKLQETYLIT